MVTIKQRDNGEEGAFFAMQGNQEIGEMDYQWVDDQTILVYHTEVMGDHQNQGVGKKMVAGCVDFARKANVKVRPQCRYALHVFETTPEYDDVLAGR